jgi:hypothetical protein
VICLPTVTVYPGGGDERVIAIIAGNEGDLVAARNEGFGNANAVILLTATRPQTMDADRYSHRYLRGKARCDSFSMV